MCVFARMGARPVDAARSTHNKLLFTTPFPGGSSMKRVMLTAVVFAAVAVNSRGEDADARKIVDAAVKATGSGGKNKAVSWTGKGKFYGMGEGIDYTGT